MPAALVLPTPLVDLTESGDTFHTLDGVHGGLRSQLPVNLLYADGHDLAEPYLSPLFADLTGFPPTFLSSGTRDLLLSSTVRMHRRLLAAGVEVELHIFEAMPHGGFSGSTPEDVELDAAINTFLDKHRRPTREAASSTDANKLIAYRYFDERWNHHNTGIIEELLGAGMDAEAEKAHLEATHAAFGDLRVTIDDLIAENDQVVVRWTATGRYQPEVTGSTAARQRTTFHGLARLRIFDGKIVSFEGFSDLAETLADS